MSVDDHGLEAIRKSAVEITPGSKAEYKIRANITDGLLSQPNGGRVTFVSIDDTTWTKVPTTPVTSRVHICIQNISEFDIHIEHELDGTPTSRGVTRGVKLASGSERFYDISPGANIWVRGYTGSSTIEICVEELKV